MHDSVHGISQFNWVIFLRRDFTVVFDLATGTTTQSSGDGGTARAFYISYIPYFYKNFPLWWRK